MSDREFLVSYGRSGEFGRFSPVASLPYQRGERVVVRAPHGLDLGVVMCEATQGHARYLSRTALGELLRPVSEEDERTAERWRLLGLRIADHARTLAEAANLPIVIVDVEVSLDGRQAIVHHLRSDECDFRSLVATLSRTHDLLIVMHNLHLPAEPAEEEVHGCGKPGCGQEDGGGCSSCGTGGGCSSCSSGMHQEDVSRVLAGVREAVTGSVRTPLL